MDPAQALRPLLDNLFVETRARLLNHARLDRTEVLTLQMAGTIFEAHVPSPPDGYTVPPQGSMLGLTGVYRVLTDEARSPVSFQILVHSVADIRVIARPSWWTFRHTAAVLGLMAIICGVGVLWVMALRREVAERTESLRESESKFRSLVEDSLVGVYIIQDDIFVYVNPRMAAILGYTPEEFLETRTLRDVVMEDDSTMVEEQILRRTAGDKRSVHVSFRACHKDGSIVQLEILGTGTEFGGRPAVVGTALDITERKRAEEELFKSRQMLQTVLDTIPQRVFWKDRDSIYVGCNRSFATDCGYAMSSDIVRPDRLRNPDNGGRRGATRRRPYGDGVRNLETRV